MACVDRFARIPPCLGVSNMVGRLCLGRREVRNNMAAGMKPPTLDMLPVPCRSNVDIPIEIKDQRTKTNSMKIKGVNIVIHAVARPRKG